MVYIDDTTKEKYKGVFNSNEYLSFFSIPILENESDGDVIAILNMDSDRVNHIVDSEFIEKKIIPALEPSIAIIKVLRNLCVSSL